MREKSLEVNTAENNKSESNHWQLVRKVAGFQLKLALDGLRDVLLSPISIGAAVLGLITRPDDPEKYFRELLQFGAKSDKWINLFDAPEHRDSKQSSDDYLDKIEDLVVNEYHKGGVLKSVKDHTDQLIDKAQNKIDTTVNSQASGDSPKNRGKN